MNFKWFWVTSKDFNEKYEQLLSDIRALRSIISELDNQTMKLKTLISAHNEAIGRILAVTHKNLGISEFDEKRKAESDEIGKKAIERLIAEQQVRQDKGYVP